MFSFCSERCLAFERGSFGVATMGANKQRLPGKGAAGLPPPALNDEAADLVVDDDDVAFVRAHRRQLQHLAVVRLEEAPCVPVARLWATLFRTCA